MTVIMLCAKDGRRLSPVEGARNIYYRYSIWVDCGNYWVDCGLGNWLHFAPEEISSSRLNTWGELEEIRTESKIFRLVERRLAWA